MNRSKVFLGGTCNGPEWRDELIPLLRGEYFNPVVKDWNEEAQNREKQEKQDCGLSLYVLTPYMAGVFSIAEMVEDSITRRAGCTVVCVLDSYKGQSFEKKQKSSLDATLELLKGHGCHVVQDLQQCAGIINSLAENPPSDVYLLKNKWLSLKKMWGPTGEYVYSHEERCEGHIVAILPWRRVSDRSMELFYVRDEFTPPWSANELQRSCFTGGVDEGEGFAVAAARELFEETGYQVDLSGMISLGTIRGAKSSDTIYHLFCVDLTGLEPVKVVKGEDANEARAKNVWVSTSNLGQVQDPILYSLQARWELTIHRPTDNFLGMFKWA